MAGLASLLYSRKFWITLVAVGVAGALAFAGEVEGEQALEFVKWMAGFWVASIAGEDMASKLTINNNNK